MRADRHMEQLRSEGHWQRLLEERVIERCPLELLARPVDASRSAEARAIPMFPAGAEIDVCYGASSGMMRLPL